MLIWHQNHQKLPKEAIITPIHPAIVDFPRTHAITRPSHTAIVISQTYLVPESIRYKK
jgi:hypothetical protein